METYNYQYQAPRQPMFNGTVFITVLAALVTFAALCFGGFMLFQKMKQNEGQPALSNEDIEAQKAVNAQTILASGLKAKKVAEPIIEEIKEVIEETLKDVNEDFNDTMTAFLQEKHPQLKAIQEQPSAELVLE